MNVDGYRIEEDKSFSVGEQYFIYKSDKQVGWVRMHLGLLRVATTYPPTSFLYCEPFGETIEDYFLSAKDFRKAMRIAIKVLEDFYNDHPDPKKNILAIFGQAEEVPLSQAPLFAFDTPTTQPNNQPLRRKNERQNEKS